MESDDHEEDKIYDNVMRIDQELIKSNSPIQEYASHIANHYIEKMNDNQDQEEKQLRQSSPPPIFEPQIPLASSLVKTRSNNLTEIDEDDFFYQGPSPYATTIDNNLISNIIEESSIQLFKIEEPSSPSYKIEEPSIPSFKLEEPSIPSYKIDEYIDEDDNDERDHVKELEETIANISRHFPVSSQQINDIDLNPIETNLHQLSSLAVGKIDIDSILEMEIESPSTDKHFIQSSTSIHPSSTSSQHALNIPISVPISVNNRRGSLSRSSGIRENLTDLLTTTTTTTTESYPTDDRPLQRTSSIHSKVYFQFSKINIIRNSRQFPFSFN
jgi:hypothetical protein